MAQLELPVKVKIVLDNAWYVRPGDRLVLTYSRELDQAEKAVVIANLSEILPDVTIVIIDGAQMAVYRDALADRRP